MVQVMVQVQHLLSNLHPQDMLLSIFLQTLQQLLLQFLHLLLHLLFLLLHHLQLQLKLDLSLLSPRHYCISLLHQMHRLDLLGASILQILSRLLSVLLPVDGLELDSLFHLWIDSTGKVVLLDTHSNTFFSQPTYASQQDGTDISGMILAGQTTIRFTRLLDTQDSQDTVLSYKTINLDWAYLSTGIGSGSGFGATFSKHDNAGNINTNLFTYQPQNAFTSPETDFGATWSLNSNLLTFTLNALTTGWIGVGFSASNPHVSSDMYIGWIDSVGNVVFLGTNSNSQSMQIFDSQQDAVSVSGSFIQNHVSITFSRVLNTLDVYNDYIFTALPVDLCWAYHSFSIGSATGADAVYPMHTNMDDSVVNLLRLSNTVDPFDYTLSTAVVDVAWAYHKTSIGTGTGSAANYPMHTNWDDTPLILLSNSGSQVSTGTSNIFYSSKLDYTVSWSILENTISFSISALGWLRTICLFSPHSL